MSLEKSFYLKAIGLHIMFYPMPVFFLFTGKPYLTNHDVPCTRRFLAGFGFGSCNKRGRSADILYVTMSFLAKLLIMIKTFTLLSLLYECQYTMFWGRYRIFLNDAKRNLKSGKE